MLVEIALASKGKHADCAEQEKNVQNGVQKNSIQTYTVQY